jgi:(1->4)-alpha-D-glucan 1-alpha-D-glucosylmutase
MWRLLRLRHERQALFVEGAYVPLHTSGTHARHAVAYARRHGRQSVVTVVPRLVASLGLEAGAFPCGSSVWADTRVDMPFLGADAELRDVVTGRAVRLARGGIALAELLRAAPVAVLAA